MSDLGSIGTITSLDSFLTLPAVLYPKQPDGFRPTLAINLGSFETLYVNTSRDDTDGYPSPPSMKVWSKGILGPFRIPVAVGTRSVTCRVYYTPDDGSSTRPQLIVKANTTLGVQFDYISTAGAGAETWLNMPTLSIPIATSGGAIKIYLISRNPRVTNSGVAGTIPVYTIWDQLSVT